MEVTFEAVGLDVFHQEKFRDGETNVEEKWEGRRRLNTYKAGRKTGH